MTPKNYIKQTWWLMWLSIFISACTAGEPGTSQTDLTSSNTPSASLSSSVTPLVSTVTHVPFLSPTLSNTPSPFPPTSTPSPYPTLSPTEAYLLVEDLLVTNGGCELPCWWGIQPGETSWTEIEPFLQTFAWQIWIEPRQNGLTQYTAYFPLSDPPTWQESRGVSFDVNDNGIVTMIRTDTKYPVTELLERFRAPAQIWLLAYPVQPIGQFEYELYLFYPRQGIMGVYADYGNIKTANDQKQFFAFCQSTFSQTGHAVWMWKPDIENSFQHILSSRRNLEQLARYKLLVDVSSWDEKMFFDTFSDPVTISCLEIPVDAFETQ